MYQRRIITVGGYIVKEQDRDLLMRFDAICRKLRRSGADLSKIKIVMEHGAKGTYITKRILEDLQDVT